MSTPTTPTMSGSSGYSRTSSTSSYSYTSQISDSGSYIGEFLAECIPDRVIDSIVYADTEGTLTAQHVHNFSKSASHKFVKKVIQTGKLSVFTHLRAVGLKMNLGDLIYIACQYGHLDLVSAMMDSGRVHVNEVTKYGWTPLEIAAVNGRKEVVQLLVQKYDADINLQFNRQYSPLENAIEGGHLDTVVAMIHLKASYSKKILEGRVDYLESKARLVINQGELINQGNDYDKIKEVLIALGMTVNLLISSI